jgi:hypothetical protein
LLSQAGDYAAFKFQPLPLRHPKATLTCDDGNGNAVYSKRIPFTDFPLDEISLYYCNKTILLPSEY